MVKECRLNLDEGALRRLIDLMRYAESKVEHLLVEGAFPRLWFGNINAYCQSKLRVLTVGLNPSGNDFRPLTKRNKPNKQYICGAASQAEWLRRNRDDEGWLEVYKSFLDGIPLLKQDAKVLGHYDSWFDNYSKLLAGIEAEVGYTVAYPSALHVDLCTPFATDKKWSDLKKERCYLMKSGIQLFSDLLEILKPHIVVASVNRDALARWLEGRHQGNEPFYLSGRKSITKLNDEFGGTNCLMVSGAAGCTPLQMLNDSEKRELARLIANELGLT